MTRKYFAFCAKSYNEKTGEEHSLKYWGTGSDLGDKITVRYLPHTEYGYVVE